MRITIADFTASMSAAAGGEVDEPAPSVYFTAIGRMGSAMVAAIRDGKDGELALTALRGIAGLLFIAHLYWKFCVFPSGLQGWWQNFTANGYPWFVPWYVISAEIAGAVLLIPGVWARWVSLYTVPMMLGAAHFWAVRKGFWFVAGGAELPTIWALLLLIIALFGDGAHAALRSPTPWSPKRQIVLEE